MPRMAESVDQRGGDVLVQELHRHGVRHIFGMPGSHVTTIYDALFQHGGIRTILMRNEQAASYAADGYARATGKPGVVCTTAGPGATNALSGIAEAWSDSVPVLLLAGQVNSDRMHLECGAYHEADLERIFRPVTKYCHTLGETIEIPQRVAEAFAALTTGRCRPATLILPQDLMRQASTGARAAEAPRPALENLALDGQAIQAAAALLADAQRPIVLAGGGALWADAADEVRAIAERLQAPVVTSQNAKGLLDERDPLSLGHARSVRAKAALPHADAMLAIGCRFTEVLTTRRRMPVPANLVQIDLEPAQIGMNYPVKVGVIGDAKLALAALLEALPCRTRSGWGPLWQQARAARSPEREWLIETLRAELPPETCVFADACEIGYRMHADWPTYAPRTFFYPSNYIALGWGFPAALGAAVARPEIPVVAVCGDGGFVMNSQELATAVRYRLRLLIIVHNDSTFGAIKNIQQRVHTGRYLDVELNNPDFLQLAAAYKVSAYRVQASEALAGAVRRALKQVGPTLIEVPDEWRSHRG
jgi:acetolactate synthase I/II/III large subunit